MRLAVILPLVLANVGFYADSYAQVTYALGDIVPLIANDFYAGAAGPGAPASASGRFVFQAKPSKSGREIVFSGVNCNLSGWGLFVMELDDPASWRQIAPGQWDLSTPLGWSPDDSSVFVHTARVDIATGAISAAGVMDGNASALPSNNWVIGTKLDQLLAVPILPDGSQDGSREQVYLTDFQDTSGFEVSWPNFSPNMSTIAFASFRDVGPPNLSDAYLLSNVAAIMGAQKRPGTDISMLAPTSLTDPSVIPVRTTEDGVDNFAHVAAFSQDGSLLLYGEDWNNAFFFSNFFGSIAAGNWDVMVSNSDGSGSDFRIVAPLNQFVTGVTPGGIRILYTSGTGTDFRLFATSLETTTPAAGDDVSNLTLEVDLGGGETGTVTLGDNATQIPVASAEPVVVSDASETSLALPPGQVIDYPTGEPQAITITTPVNPVEEPQLPPGADAIPVLREFGPAGTSFYPPVEVTIAYTDAEIAGLNESSLIPYVYNTTSMMFEPIDEGDIVLRDLVNNRVTFRVSHFSLYGIGGTETQLSLTWPVWVVLGVLLMFGTVRSTSQTTAGSSPSSITAQW